jgi:hypothetical protein
VGQAVTWTRIIENEEHVYENLDLALVVSWRTNRGRKEKLYAEMYTPMVLVVGKLLNSMAAFRSSKALSRVPIHPRYGVDE